MVKNNIYKNHIQCMGIHVLILIIHAGCTFFSAYYLASFIDVFSNFSYAEGYKIIVKLVVVFCVQMMCGYMKKRYWTAYNFVHGVKKEDFHLLTLRDGKHTEGYRTDIELLRASLDDYLLSKNTVYKFEYNATQRGYDIIFGLECYNYICELPIDRLDVRAFHLLWSNKILMSLRIKYLSHMYSGIDDNLINFCDKIAAELLLVRNMVLKSRLRPDEQLHRRISNKMKEIQEKDRIFISRLLEILK